MVSSDDGHDPLEEALRAKLSAALESISSSMTLASSALMPLVSEQDLTGLQELYKIDDLSDGLLSPGWDRNRFSSSSRDSRGLDSSIGSGSRTALRLARRAQRRRSVSHSIGTLHVRPPLASGNLLLSSGT